MRNKKLIIPVILVAAAAGIFALVLSRKTYAQNTDQTFPPLVERIVQRFNLNRAEVAQVVNQYNAEQNNNSNNNNTTASTNTDQTVVARDETSGTPVSGTRADLENKLSQAVQEGKITEQQKVNIITQVDNVSAWIKQERTNINANTHMTQAERDAKYKELRSKIQTWMNDFENWATAQGMKIRDVLGDGFFNTNNWPWNPDAS